MNPLERHVAGATVVHASPFSALEVPVDEAPLPHEIIRQWVTPLYMKLGKPEFREFILRHRSEIDDALLAQLLASFNWRPRLVAAYLCAIAQRTAFSRQIGRLLLRSDVCYAGKGYCLALAAFNAPESIAFLEKYLDYYLTRKDLWFDQADAMAAVAYLDRVNGTSMLAGYMDRWNAFIADHSPPWDLAGRIAAFERLMASIGELRSAA